MLEKLPMCLDEDQIENAIFPKDGDDKIFQEILVMNSLLGGKCQMRNKEWKIKFQILLGFLNSRIPNSVSLEHGKAAMIILFWVNQVMITTIF